ncbi:MAG TPA: glutamate-1-semialdehyde 2,1-aminomutase [Terriglobales bacterium]|nr:glutamate-1-semialdehyde 2,1-aminomutase [Terriglobales bacterium]
MNRSRSEALQRRAETLIPGGVDSPVRSFRAVGGNPPWFERGEGAYLFDADGNRYLDCIASWGALLFGHAPPAVTAAIAAAAARGTSFGASTPGELELAEAVARAMPAVEMLRFVNSGTEATMSAARLARGCTGREGILKFSGGYHGHADLFLSEAGSGVATLGIATSAGVPAGAVLNTHTVAYNDLEAVERVLVRQRGKMAAIIVEPVAGNMGCVPPTPAFLPGLRELATRHGALLIFDEVMTGFRLARGGACERYGIRPDLVTLGKILGGGLPVAAYGGRRDLMQQVAPLGPVYQAGTLSGNPLAMAAGIASLGLAAAAGVYEGLETCGLEIERGLTQAIAEAGAAARVQRVGSMLTVFFRSEPVTNFDEARACDTRTFARFHARLLEQGVLWPPSQFEAAFFGTAHGAAEIEALVGAVRSSL